MRGWCAGLAVALSLVAPGTAHAAYVSSASLYSDEHDFIGRGVDRVVHPGNAAHLGAGMDFGAMVAGLQRHGDDGFGVSIAAPPGEVLEPRNYVGAWRFPFNDERPGLDVGGGNRGCNELEGQFEVKDIALNPDGTAKRLWVLYEQHCEGAPAAAWGEVRINAWVPDSAAKVAPGIVRWPEIDSWEPVNTVPVTYLGSAAVARVEVAGANPGDFAIVDDGCTGRAGPCDVSVQARPTAAGTRSAVLRFTDAAGGVQETALEAFRHGGVTDADLEVLAGDVAGEPGRYTFTPENAEFRGSSTLPRHAGLALRERGSDWFWRAYLYAGMDGTLAPGTYTGRGDTYGPEPGVEVSGPPTGCNRTAGSFTIHSIDHLPDASLRSLDVSVENGCYDDQRPALRGRWRFRAGASEALAPWMFPGPRPAIDVPPDPAGPGDGEPVTVPTTTVATPGLAVLPASPSTALASALRADGRALRSDCPAPVERTARLVRGTAAGDRLLGRAGADLVLAGPGRDTVRARGGRDCVAGGSGADRLDGGPGADVLLGQGGNDVLVGGPGRDVLDCGAGRRDRAVASRTDRVRGCERVSRPRPRRRR